jgi:putative phosphoribosyl transferase
MPQLPQSPPPARWQRPQVPGQSRSREVRIPVGSQWLYGDLVLPADMHGLVLFAHGSGSGRHSSRNRLVAAALHQAGIGTLLLDLLTAQEEQVDVHTAEHRFNIALLTDRMLSATLWVLQQPGLWEWPLGYFGASTGCAAALIAAARLDGRIAAVVSRGGRPDLAGQVTLASVTAPTLLIVGGADRQVLQLNTESIAQMHCDKRLAIVPGAGHLFEEPGALQEVSRLACEWFGLHFRSTLYGQPMASAEQRAWGVH